MILFSGQTVWGNWKGKEDPFLFTSVCVGCFHLTGVLTLLPNAGAPVVGALGGRMPLVAAVSRVWSVWGGECGKFAKHGEAFAVFSSMLSLY